MSDNIKWLTEIGGPSVKLQLMHEGMIESGAFDAQELIGELLSLDKFKTARMYFDKFKNFLTMTDNELFGSIHNCYEDCFEMFMPFFTRLGFRSGLSPELDEKAGYMKDVYRYLISQDESGKRRWSHVHGLSIILYLLQAGYYNDDMTEYMAERINKAYKIAETGIFGFYETDPSKIKRRPKVWENTPVLKDIHNCEIGEIPLPTSYLVMGALYFIKPVKDTELIKKTEDIIKYILDPRYQEKRGDYGIHWTDGKGYHASAAGVGLPFYNSSELTGSEKTQFKSTLEFMSCSDTALKSDWFAKCMEYLGRFKTERGTYILPEDMLYHVFVRPANTGLIYGAYISKDVLPSVKRTFRKPAATEICSTLFAETMLHKQHKANVS